MQFLKNHDQERVQDVRRADLEAYRLALVDGNLAPASIEIYLRSVRQFFAWLESNQILFLNPAAGLVIPAPARKLLPVPSEEEIRRLLAQPDVKTSCGLRDRALLETAYSTGARGKELCGLQVSDLDLEQGLVRVLGKGNKQRVVPIGKTALRLLESYLKAVRPFLLSRADEPALFLNHAGQRMPYHTFRRIVHRSAEAAGLEMNVTPHTFRRSCTTELIRAGANLYHVKELLGHENLETLKHYTRLTIQDLKATHARCHPRENEKPT